MDGWMDRYMTLFLLGWVRLFRALAHKKIKNKK